MKDKQQILDELNVFRKKHKFSDSAWNKRGLNPSSSEMCGQLERLFNSIADALIDLVNSHTTQKQLKKMFKTALSKFDRRAFDTEEGEFICDYMFELSEIVDTDIKNDFGLTI